MGQMVYRSMLEESGRGGRMRELEKQTGNLIEFAKEQSVVFPEDSEMGWYLRETIKILQAEPCEKFKSAKDHINKLAGDYKCWDNRLTHDEALELCKVLEQEPREDEVTLTKKSPKRFF